MLRTLALYVVAAWLLLQAADVLFPAWDIPESGIRYVLYAVLAGLPVALVFAWFFDVGPEGIRRTSAADQDEAQPMRGRDFVLLGALVAVLAAIGYGLLGDLDEPPDGPELATAPVEAVLDGPPVIAVLPFAADGANEDSALFAEGVHDDLLTQLSRLGSLRVISRTSVLGYRDTARNLRAIGEELGASVILEGLVRVAGEQIRINAQLIDARTDEHLWAETYDRSLTPENLFVVQGDIAQAIAGALDTELTREESAQLEVIPTRSMGAYRAYRAAMDRFAGDMAKDEYLADLERAVELDPDFTQALAELAGALAFRGRRPAPEHKAGIARSEALIDHLGEIAPESVEHLFAQSYYVYYVLRDYALALSLVNQAIEKSPSNLRLLQLKSWIERRQGDYEARARTVRQMRQLAPLDDAYRMSLVNILMTLHRYDEAWSLMTPLDIDHPRLFEQYALLASRHLETPEARIANMVRLLDGKAEQNPFTRFMTRFNQRDFEGALALADGVEDPPHWGEVLMTTQTQMRLLAYWALGDEASLATLVQASRQRAAAMLAENPGVADDHYFWKGLLSLDVLEGNTPEALQALRSWERETLNDWAVRAGERSEICSMYAMLGLPGETVACLRTGLEEPSTVEPFVDFWTPFYDPVRESPEFQRLLTEF